jgi:hypothetical protein
MGASVSAWGTSWLTSWGSSWGATEETSDSDGVGLSRGRGVSYVVGVSTLNRVADHFITDGVGN